LLRADAGQVIPMGRPTLTAAGRFTGASLLGTQQK